MIKKFAIDIKVFLKKKKKKVQQYGHERYKNLPEYEKQKLFDYRKKNYKKEKAQKSEEKASYYNYKKQLF